MTVNQGPVDMSLLAPHDESLERLGNTLYGRGFQQLTPSEKTTVYQLAVAEQISSALSVIAQACVRIINA